MKATARDPERCKEWASLAFAPGQCSAKGFQAEGPSQSPGQGVRRWGLQQTWNVRWGRGDGTAGEAEPLSPPPRERESECVAWGGGVVK